MKRGEDESRWKKTCCPGQVMLVSLTLRFWPPVRSYAYPYTGLPAECWVVRRNLGGTGCPTGIQLPRSGLYLCCSSTTLINSSIRSDICRTLSMQIVSHLKLVWQYSTVVCSTLTVFGLLLFWLCLCMTIHIPSPQTSLTINEFWSQLVVETCQDSSRLKLWSVLYQQKLLLCWVISGKFFLGSSYNGGWELNYYTHLYTVRSLEYKRNRSC